MLIGYARVSSEDQNPGYQLDALTAAGCVQVFQDRATGSTYDRVGLDQALAALTPGSTLVVWKLDRVGRSMLETVRIIVDLDRRGIEFRSLTESFDTKTPLGRGVLGLFAAVAEDELHRLKARTREGMKAAKRRGKHVGRPFELTPEKLDLAHKLLADGKGKAATARAIDVHPSTLRRHLNKSTAGF